MFDKEIRSEQIQAIRNADGVAALFAKLGYRTEARITQTADVLGITPESTCSQIKKIELIADQEGRLQIYLFEVASLTQALTHTIARAFRNRAGNYLLVLTADYDRLDFVLIERSLSTSKIETLIPKQVTLRPRVVSIERQNPGRIHLRLLRRLTYTESAPEFQFEKLRSAFDMAEWSEEFFNNRGLFSDYYLIERVPKTEAWKDDPKPAHRRLGELLNKASERWAGKPKTEILTGFIQPALEVLGLTASLASISATDSPQPDFLLSVPSAPTSPVAFCLIYPWGRWLDGKDDRRDAETPHHNPGARVVSLLESGTARWAVLTNGKVWRLYSGKAHSRATNYYEIDLEETLAQPGPQGNDAAEAFRYFWLFFRGKAFESQPSFLDDILSGSEAYAKKLGDRLKERIFEEIFPIFSEGFIAHIHQRDGKCADLSQQALNQVFQGTLTILYRLLFVLYAESRDLLPVKEFHGYGQKSLKLLKEEIAGNAKELEGWRDGQLGKAYSAKGDSLYVRLMALCAVIDKGDRALNVPMYNGGLFMTEPPEDDSSLEAENARFLRDHVIPDRWLARGFDRLARDVDDKSHALVFIDYKSLGVRHLGSIYEGLLEFKLRLAAEKMAVVEGKKTEEIIPYREAQHDKRGILKVGRGKDADERVFAPGAIYLENDRRERKATGSYYTPDYIVQYIVEHAVGPVLEEKFAAIAPKLRDAQKALKQERDKAAALKRMVGKHDDPEHETYLKHRHVLDELFDVKVLDPAMGSGHFLVETVDFITDRLLHFLNGFPWNPVLAHLKETRETILQEMERQGISIDVGRLSDVNLLKRHVLKRCIYGVDFNPMAVELAKVSLWLDCFTLGAPLSFLDHHLKCGNSLIGTTVEEVDKALETPEQTSFFHTSEFARELVAVDLMRRIGELSDVTPDQVRESRREFQKAMSALVPAKTVMDVYVSRWFGNEPVNKTVGAGVKPELLKKRKALHDFALDFLRADTSKQWLKHPQEVVKLGGNDRKTAETAIKAAKEKRFFHWEIEFPEVFFAPRYGTTQVVEKRPNAGFDAVVGNPPYDVLASGELGYDASEDLAFYESAPVYEPAIRGKKNLYKLFICRGVAATRPAGAFSFIVPMPLLGDDQSAGIRRLLLEKTGLIAIESFPQKDDPHNRVFPEAKLATSIFVTRANCPGTHFTVRTHQGRLIEESSSLLRLAPAEIFEFDPDNSPIPSCTQRDWDIAVKIIKRERIVRLGLYCRASQGEVNETTDGKKGFISTNPKDGPQILRGSNICLYVTREASQGEEIFLRKQKYLRGKPDSVKALHHEQRRVGWQETSPQNNFRRIIAAGIPREEFCNHKINYVPENDAKIALDFLLALLNSKVSDWFFRLGSTNAAVSHYQIYNLPAPTIHLQANDHSAKRQLCADKAQWAEAAKVLSAAITEPGVMPETVAEAIAEMSRRIQDIEAERALANRSERSHLAAESQPIQDAIDAVLFRCYGLSDDDARYVSQRLGEML